MSAQLLQPAFADPVLDAQRFERTEGGVVLITRDMLEKLGSTAE